MNVLMVSTDRKILDAESAVAKRMCEYGELSERLTILLLGTGDRSVADLSERVHVVFPGGMSKREAYKNAFWEGMREARELPASLVTTQDPFFVGFVGWRIARALHVPLQVQAHTDFLNTRYIFSSFRKMFEVLLSFFVLSQATCIRVVSKRIARSLAFFKKANIHILPIHVPERTVSEEVPPEYTTDKKILMVARLEHEKNVATALHALTAIPEMHLYIVGDGSLRESLERLARTLNIENRTHFLGWHKHTEPYYQHADVFLQLSRFEGYGISLVEAAYAKLPIVTTHVGVVGDIFIPSEDVVITNGKPADVAECIQEIIEHPEKAARYAEQAYQKAHAHGMTHEKYLELYKRTWEECAR